MKCRSCGCRLAHVHNYPISGDAVAKRLRCDSCGTIYTAVELLVHEDPARGQGAYSLAKALSPEQIEAASKSLKNN